MSKKFCMVVPAIIDEDCISDSVDSYIKNIIQCNDAESIRFIIHLDNFQYDGHKGTMDSVIKLYEQLKPYVSCEIYYSEKRKGLKSAFQLLMEKFLENDDEFYVYFDDDHQIINPLPLSGSLDKFLYDSRYIVHLADTDIKTSHETTQLMDKSVFENDEIIIRKNNKHFHTQVGTFLSRELILSVYDEYCLSSPRSSEKIMGDLILKNIKPTPEILTVCVNSGVPLNVDENKEFGKPAPTQEFLAAGGVNEGIMRMEDHFTCDGRRFIKSTGKFNQGVFNYG